MTHTLLCWRVIHPDTYRFHGDTSPGGKHQQFEFCLITRGNQTQPFQHVQGIESESALSIRQGNARLQFEPEIRETVGKRVLSGHVFFRQITASHDDCLRIPSHLLHQERDVVCKMLPVGIDGHSMGETHLLRLLEACHQRMTLTLVLRMGHHGDTCRECL